MDDFGEFGEPAPAPIQPEMNNPFGEMEIPNGGAEMENLFGNGNPSANFTGGSDEFVGAPPAEQLDGDMFGAPMEPPDQGDIFGAPMEAPLQAEEVMMGNGEVDPMAHMMAPEQAAGFEDDLLNPMSDYTFAEPTSVVELWQKEQYEKLQAKEAEEKLLKEKTRQEAAEEKDHLYAQRNAEMEAKRKNNRENEAIVSTGYTPGVGSLWENVHGLVDMTPKNNTEGRTDLTRMRQLFVKLKHSPPVTIGHVSNLSL